jgi:SAM-dependent methyltransferase
MDTLCPLDLDAVKLQQDVRDMYTRVATAPDGEFHFHRGPRYAAERLGYDAQELAALPPDVTARFAGIGNPHAIAPLPAGATVLDVGCGAGTDLLLAARRIGPGGRAIGVDMTAEMRGMARAGAAAGGLANVDVRDGNATALPVDSATVDVVISNGVLNLVPDKRTALSEIRRVLRPGGLVQIADIVLGVDLPESARRDVDLWAA